MYYMALTNPRPTQAEIFSDLSRNFRAGAVFTTWELVRGSNVVRNLHLEAPLSAALANGANTLSITADCYSVAAADAALAAALLAYYTSAQVDALSVDYRTGTAQDAETTSQGNVGCDQLLRNDVNCTDVFTTGVDASGAVSCAALTATGTVTGATLTSTGAVSGSSLSITGAASVGLLSSATGITGSTLTINNTANAGNFTTVGDVSTGTLTASGAATAASFAATGAVTGATLTITGAASAGPLDCESLDCTFTATSGGVSTGSVVCGDATSSGTVSAPQLFASNTLTVTNTSDFSDDLFLTKNWAAWSKLQISNNSAASDSGPELRLLGNQSARVFLERDGGVHQRKLIMINDEALVQTKSLSTQLSLTTNQRNPGCLVIAGNTGNVVCNTSFTDLSDSRVKTEIAEADVAVLIFSEQLYACGSVYVATEQCTCMLYVSLSEFSQTVKSITVHAITVPKTRCCASL